ncbi:MAG: glycoside hydrolase family 36 protein [Opitutaceae bacterium]
MKSDLLPKIHREVRCGATTALYVQDRTTGRLGLWLVPASRRQLTPRRKILSGVEIDGILDPTGKGLPAWAIESLLQVKVREDDAVAAFAQGRTMRNSPTTERMKFTTQKITRTRERTAVRTSFTQEEGGWSAHHDLVWRKGASWLESRVTVENTSAQPITLEFLASFSIGGITPFAPGDAPGRLKLHRFRSVWSMEGRLETRAFEDLQLERSWGGNSVRNERFGQLGSLPVNGFFPFVAVEDTGAGVTWGAQLAHPGSWQMEVYRRDDLAAISGGLADRELGHWMKTIAPGASFTSPTATLACVAGDLDDVCAAMTTAQELPLATVPESEQALPVMFNEWATSWGNPNHANMVALAQELQGTGLKYLVIDAGWSKPDDGAWSSAQGDWQPNKKMYPHGIRATADAIRACGLIPGIWFEMEVVGSASSLWARTDLLLQRDGRVITVGGRRFLDLRNPAVVELLTERVIELLRAGNFGYLKVDYNDNIGLGVDGAESPGEGLRQHLGGVQAFFRKLRVELPDLVIENCSSGGHRLEPSMMALTSMSSFSDAHECPEIPIIAANLHRLMLPRQSQIWAVLRDNVDVRRIVYLLAGGFLGRLCLSGHFPTLRKEQRVLVDRAIALYAQAASVIRHGRSRRYGPEVAAYRHAKGWQVVVRAGADGKKLLVVGHAFEKPGVKSIRVPLPPGKWRVMGEIHTDRTGVKLTKGELRWTPAGDWSANVVLLSR